MREEEKMISTSMCSSDVNFGDVHTKNSLCGLTRGGDRVWSHTGKVTSSHLLCASLLRKSPLNQPSVMVSKSLSTMQSMGKTEGHHGVSYTVALPGKYQGLQCCCGQDWERSVQMGRGTGRGDSSLSTSQFQSFSPNS